MNKTITIAKNKMDLAYHRQMQLLNTVVILGTTGLLSFLGTFLWRSEMLLQGLLISAFIGAVCLNAYSKINDKLKKISDELTKLAESRP